MTVDPARKASVRLPKADEKTIRLVEETAEAPPVDLMDSRGQFQMGKDEGDSF